MPTSVTAKITAISGTLVCCVLTSKIRIEEICRGLIICDGVLFLAFFILYRQIIYVYVLSTELEHKICKKDIWEFLLSTS